MGALNARVFWSFFFDRPIKDGVYAKAGKPKDVAASIGDGSSGAGYVAGSAVTTSHSALPILLSFLFPSCSFSLLLLFSLLCCGTNQLRREDHEKREEKRRVVSLLVGIVWTRDCVYLRVCKLSLFGSPQQEPRCGIGIIMKKTTNKHRTNKPR